MTTNFTASNGVVIGHNQDWSALLNAGYSPAVITTALREFFLHERDERLGRVRWPENPDYVIYPPDKDGWARVMCESSGNGAYHSADRVSRFLENYKDDVSQYALAAAWYFENHPPRKPWHDAKPGEAWVVTWDERASACIVAKGKFSESGLVFKDGERFICTFASDITDARRIWPEEGEA